MLRTIRGFVKSGVVLMTAALLVAGTVGCGGSKTKSGGGGTRGRVSEDDLMRLEEARKAAEDAEKELSEIRFERQQLENANSN